MVTERVLRRIFVAVLLLLLVPLLPAIGILAVAAVLIAQNSLTMSGGLILCILWAALVAAVLAALILLLTHGETGAPLGASSALRSLVASLAERVTILGAGIRAKTQAKRDSPPDTVGHHPDIASEWWRR
jgi:hypothetical protein